MHLTKQLFALLVFANVGLGSAHAAAVKMSSFVGCMDEAKNTLEISNKAARTTFCQTPGAVQHISHYDCVSDARQAFGMTSAAAITLCSTAGIVQVPSYRSCMAEAKNVLKIAAQADRITYCSGAGAVQMTSYRDCVEEVHNALLKTVADSITFCSN